MPSAVSLFTGCGGSDTGLTEAGFDILMANDILPYAKSVYLENLPSTDYIAGDVKRIKSFPKADILVGCYPCQGFSQGGSRKASSKINLLYREFVRALKIIKPKAFIVENVSGMQRSDFYHLLRAQLTQFRFSGYKVNYQILDSSEFGVAQERKRLIFVGIRSNIDANFNFPKPTHIGDKKITIRKAIGDMPHWPDKSEYWTDPFHWYYMSRNRYRDWDQISKTIVSHPRHMPLHPASPKMTRINTDKWIWSEDREARRYSPLEAARLQGFDKNFKFPENEGTLRLRYTVVGNAVPPPLFKAIAKSFPDIW